MDPKLHRRGAKGAEKRKAARPAKLTPKFLNSYPFTLDTKELSVIITVEHIIFNDLRTHFNE